jgi:hypothetical protein
MRVSGVWSLSRNRTGRAGGPAMKRCTVFRGVAIAMVLGVVSSTGVAWAFALLESVDSHRAYLSGNMSITVIPGPHEVFVVASQIDRALGTRRVVTVCSTQATTYPGLERGTPPDWCWDDVEAWAPAVQRLGGHYAFAFGWPMRSMWISYETTAHWTARNGIVLSKSNSPSRPPIALPTRLLPVGIAVDCALYAALCWMLLFGIKLARVWLRTRAGKCTNCGYSLPGLTLVCPECGAQGCSESQTASGP